MSGLLSYDILSVRTIELTLLYSGFVNLKILAGYPQAQSGRASQPPPRAPPGLNLKKSQGGQRPAKGGIGGSAKTPPAAPRKQRLC